MIKRIMSVILCGALSAGIVGCGKSEQQATNGSKEQANVESNVIDDGNIGKSNSGDLDDIPQISGDEPSIDE